MPKYLAIDYGLERTGLAMSDPEGRMAVPFRVLALSEYGNRKKQLDALAEIACAYRIDAIVLGLPLHGDGSESEMSRLARKIGARIARRLDLPIFLEPEYLSSFAAGQATASRAKTAKKRQIQLDAHAACQILESFLDQPENLRRRL